MTGRILSALIVSGVAVVCLIGAGVAESQDQPADVMASNRENWSIYREMYEIAPTHFITRSVEPTLVWETSFFRSVESFNSCTDENCKAEAIAHFRAALPEYRRELELMYSLQLEVAAGKHDMSVELRTLWYRLVGVDESQLETVIAELRALEAQASGAANAETTGEPVETPTHSSTPEYRREMVKGTTYLVGQSSGVEVWTNLMCRDAGCDKTVAYIFVRNAGTEAFTLIPESHVSLTAFDDKGGARAAHTFSPPEWVRKQENKAAWKAFGTGVMIGLANSGPSGTYSGTHSGSYGYGSYYGTYTDYAQKRANIARDSEYFGSRIAQALENNTVNLLWAETLSPGEEVGGQVYFAKHESKAATLRLSVVAGGTSFHFEWSN